MQGCANGVNMSGKTIRLYIMGDEKKNLKTAELGQWTGKAFIGERKHTKLLQNIEELSFPGLYFLISEDEASIQKDIYIGEADEVNKRINDHYRKKDWWDKFVIFISKDSNLTKAHVRFLEKKLYKIIKENTTAFNLNNLSEPSGSKLPESDIAELEEFSNNLIFVLKNLGILDFAKVTQTKIETIDIKNIFYLNLTTDRTDDKGNILQAKLFITNDGYKLLKESFIEKNPRQSFPSHSYYPLRKKLEEEHMFKESPYNGCFILSEDVDFNSPSAAASIVKNRLTNGRKEWKLKEGTTLDEFESSIEKVSQPST